MEKQQRTKTMAKIDEREWAKYYKNLLIQENVIANETKSDKSATWARNGTTINNWNENNEATRKINYNNIKILNLVCDGVDYFP